MNNCDQPGLTPVEAALDQILSAVAPISDSTLTGLHNACGRVLSSDVVSPVAVPPQDNSAMDGYAVSVATSEQYRVIGIAYAGHPFNGTLSPGDAVRIMTGAPVPAGATVVVMQENAVVDGDSVSFKQALIQGDNIRRAGEDIMPGSVVLASGRRLTPADCGLLASIGISEVSVVRPLRIALLTTGDELVTPGQPLANGQIYESNSYVLTPVLQRLKAEVQSISALEDSVDAIEVALRDAAAWADIVITCGGVSVGEADYTRTAVERCGQLALWKLAMKPGKPLAFGSVGDALFLGLPGNPVSSLVTLHQIGLPLLRTLSGERYETPVRMPAIAAEVFRKRPGRTDFQRGIASLNPDGKLQVRPTGQQGSGMLTSVSQANCFVILEQERGRVETGEYVTIELFDQWLS